jgi:hypothetical protein
MKNFSFLSVLCVLCASPSGGEEPAKKPAPLAACIEPAVMRTEAAQLLPGSRTTVVVPAWEDDLGLSRLTKEEFAATGLKWEQFLTEASTTAAALLKTLTPEIERDKKGAARYAVLRSESHLTASIILCPEFFTKFRETFGDRLVVLVPDRFTVYVFPRGFNDFQELGPEILDEFEDSIWPCSEEAFEITSDGLKCLGAFDGTPAEPEKPAPPAAPAPKGKDEENGKKSGKKK